MNVEAIRTLYEYHFTLNHRLWDEGIMQLTDEQFVEEIDYSIGSVRNHVVHMMSVDEFWFSRLTGAERPPYFKGTEFEDRANIRAYWDSVEGKMRAYLDALSNDTVSQPVKYSTRRMGEWQNTTWEILVHVVNHGTDHRAQLLRILHQFDAPTFEQDLMIYLWD